MTPTITFNLSYHPRRDGRRSVDLYFWQGSKKSVMSTGWAVTQQEWADITGRPRDEVRKKAAQKNRRKLKAMEQKAQAITSEGVETFQLFKQIWKSPPADTENVFWWYYQRISNLPLKTARGYYDSLRWVHRKAIGNYPPPFDDIRQLKLQPVAKVTFLEIDVLWLKALEAKMRTEGRSSNTIGIYMRNLRTIFNDALDAEVISKKQYPFSTNSGARRYSPPSGKKKPKALDKEQLAQLMNAKTHTPAERWAVDMFIFAYFANGQDFGDYFRLKWQDRQYDNKIGRYKAVIDRTKTRATKRAGAPVVIIFNDACEAIIEKYSLSQRPGDYIFPILSPGMDDEAKTKKIQNTISTINRALKRIARRVGLPEEISTRWARHSHASVLAVNQNITIFDIQEQLGHSSPKTTERYIKSLGKDSRMLDALDGLMPDREEGEPGEAKGGK